jgi:hypothetical protein
MSAFESAATGARSAPASRSGMARGAGSSASASVSVSVGGAAAPGGFQNADRQFLTCCETAERELRKLAASVAAARKLVEGVGSARDSDDLRKKLQLGLDKGRESSKLLSALLKNELAPAVDAPELGQRERGARKQQLARFQKEFQEAVQTFSDVTSAAAAATKKHPQPPAAAAGADQRGGKAKRGGGGGGEKDDPLLQRLQQVEFDSAMVDERDEAINDIATSILEVNETMRDLANIVDEQGKDIDQIETNVTAAEDNTEKGVGFLNQAEKYQKGYRKWIIALICIILVASGGMAAALVLTKKAGN